MFSTGQFRRALFASLFLLSAARSPAQIASPDASLYRIFLRDGSTVVSYGEFARVSDRVVVSLPVGGTPDVPDLHLLSLPADSVDWEKTDAYADSVRASRYAATRGPDDFALLNEAVSRALTDIALTTDPNRKIAMAGEARQNVTKWVAEHFGYRAREVAHLAGLFDTVVAETRAAAGMTNVDLSLIANMAEPPSVPLLPAPTLRESVEQALRAVALAPDASERTSLLRAIDGALVAESAAGAPWTDPLRIRVTGAIAVEERATRDYGLLTRDILQAADRSARIADVTGVERVIRRALTADDRLGQRRPQEMASLLATLDGTLDSARRLRLARDSWAARADLMRRYRAAVEEPLSIMGVSRDSLDQIRRLAGPSAARLARLTARTARAAQLIAALTVPAEGAAAHGFLRNAIQLASRAAELRQRAVIAGDMKLAWEAASAASGAIVLLERAVEELQALAKAPTIPKT
jgi:hypothetical protein